MRSSSPQKQDSRRSPRSSLTQVRNWPLKLRILSAMKKAWGGSLTTVFPRQGHYAFDPKEIASNPAADVSIERIGELADFDLDALMGENRGS